MGEAKPQRVVNCPTCGKPVPWVPQSAFRPFCSLRCRQIDLGAWAEEQYRVAETGPTADATDRVDDSGDA